MARGSPKPAAHALAPGLQALGSKHRRAVAKTIGAARDTPEAIAAVLRDEEALGSIVADLDDAARRLVTRTSFGPSYAWSTGRGAIELEVAQVLERHGLLFTFETGWGMTVCTPLDLEEPLRRIRANDHAALAPDAEPAAEHRLVHLPEQLLHDAALLAAVIGAGAIQLKADGNLFARAVPKLTAALPPLPAETPGLEATRLDLALRLLEENGALRVRGQGLPGAPAKRELALALDVPALLDVPPAARPALMDAIGRSPMPGREMIGLLLDAFAGRTVALHDVGAAVTGLFAEAAKQQPGQGAGVPDATVGLAAVTERWLRGDVGLTVDREGMPVAAVFAPAPFDEPAGLPCLAQGDFELVSMRPVTPGERAALLSVAEPVPGREHVARVTKERVHSALRCEPTLDVMERLRALAGTLPQNVEQTVEGWAQQAPRRARLRSAMMLAAPDEKTAERLAFALGRTLVERLSPTLLAVDANELPAVGKAVRQAGVELEDGLDRVSGVWAERPDRDAHPGWWRPTPPERQSSVAPPAGRIGSRLDWKPEPAPVSRARVGGGDDARSRAAAELARRLAEAGLDAEDIELVLGEDYDDELDDDDDAIEDVLLHAFERGSVVRLKYAGANGLHQEWGTVVQVEDARVKLRDHATGKLSWRWMRAIAEVEIIR
jgi:hypothetical protein